MTVRIFYDFVLNRIIAINDDTLEQVDIQNKSILIVEHTDTHMLAIVSE